MNKSRSIFIWSNRPIHYVHNSDTLSPRENRSEKYIFRREKEILDIQISKLITYTLEKRGGGLAPM